MPNGLATETDRKGPFVAFRKIVPNIFFSVLFEESRRLLVRCLIRMAAMGKKRKFTRRIGQVVGDMNRFRERCFTFVSVRIVRSMREERIQQGFPSWIKVKKDRKIETDW